MNVNAIFLVTALVSSAASAQSYTGAELRQELSLWSLLNTPGVSSQDYARLGHAMGYLDGFTDAHMHEQVLEGRPVQDSLSYCLPKEFTIKDLRRAALSYLERHKEPFTDTAPAGAVLARAFKESFPCRKR